MADLKKYQDNVKLRDLRERVREADSDELNELLDDLQREVLDLRAKAMTQGLSNTMSIRQNRKLIARIHTELGSRERAAA